MTHQVSVKSLGLVAALLGGIVGLHPAHAVLVRHNGVVAFFDDFESAPTVVPDIVADTTSDADPVPVTGVSWLTPADRPGDWNDSQHWAAVNPAEIPVVPNANNNSTIFGNAITSPQTVFTNADVTVNAIQFDNSNKDAVAGAGFVTPVVCIRHRDFSKLFGQNAWPSHLI